MIRRCGPARRRFIRRCSPGSLARLPASCAQVGSDASRYVALLHLPHGYTAPKMREALTARLLEIPPDLRLTLTWDQGRELTLHEEIERASGTRIFFCEPRMPWQRPTNENTNGLLRQYFLKRTNLGVHTRADLDRVAAELNDRPRFVLGDRTPHDVLADFLTALPTP